MNFKAAVVIAFSLVLSSATAQVTASTQNYNIVSPTQNAPYAAGQILPCTVDLLGSSNTDLNLAINLVSAFPGSNMIFTISTSFIVSETSSSEKVVNNVTYYEQSINYQIPDGVVTGLYNVVFLERTTGTQVDIPVNIIGKASNSTLSVAGNSVSTTTLNRSTFQSDGTCANYSITLCIINLFLAHSILLLL
jgi:hypothetical protein